MSWRCPACDIPIHHSDLEDRPGAGNRYRCHVCRLELIYDPDTNKLTVAAFRADTGDDKEHPPR